MPKEGSQEILNHLVAIGRVFSSGQSFSGLFRDVMEKIRSIASAEGGSLYIYDRSTRTLKSVVLTNDVLNIHQVVETFDPLKIEGFIEIPMYDKADEIALKIPLVSCFHKGQKVLVRDINEKSSFDFTNTRKFDRTRQYKTRNLIFLPLVGHNERTVGVLQIINCDDNMFSDDWQPFVDALAGQVGILLNNALLVSEAQNLLVAMVQMVGVAIDEKSPHTSGHCQRVTDLTMMILDALTDERDGRYADFSVNGEQRRELKMAALLHDIGKIVTPLHIMEKPTKLCTLHDRINLLSERFRSLYFSKKLHRLEEAVRLIGRDDLLETGDDLASDEDFQFLSAINHNELTMSDEVEERLQKIARQTIPSHGSGNVVSNQLIHREEMDNLRISRGTLNQEERKIMEDHVSVSIRLLSSIPWPHDLSRVVEYAGAHHEKMDGTGYPNNINGEKLSLPARILCIADRFEAVSAPDRPYRKFNLTLSQVMNIMQKMADSQEIDPELFEFFKEKKIYKEYASKFMAPDLIDYQ